MDKRQTLQPKGPAELLVKWIKKLNEPVYAAVTAGILYGIVLLVKGGNKPASASNLPKVLEKAPAPNLRKALRGELSEAELEKLLYRIENGSLEHELYPDKYPDLVEFWKPR